MHTKGLTLCEVKEDDMKAMIHDIAVFTAIFASGMLCGYLLKVVMVNLENRKDNMHT